MKMIVEYLPAMYLGFSLSHFANCGLLEWHFYAIAIPVICLYEFRSCYEKKEK